MIDERSLETTDGGMYKMPAGAYWDADDMLHAANGDLLPDGLYVTDEGNVVMYEGNFLNMSLE